eukprot:3683498-Pyramimonas_sp.AAC.2
MRGICDFCGATRSGTCKPPPATARRGQVSYGQGRPFGKVWAFIQRGEALGPGHSKDEHKPFVPSFEERKAGREGGRRQPDAANWLNSERPVNDGDS